MGKENMGINKKVESILENTNGNCLDVLCVIYEDFLGKNNEGEILRYLCENSEKIGSDDGASGRVPIRLEADVENAYKEFISQTVLLLLNKNEPEEVFYQNLWKTVFMSATSPKGTEECAVLLKLVCIKNRNLPYYQAKEVRQMNNEEFQASLRKIVPEMKEAVHMMQRPFSQKTELFSQLCRLMKNLDEETSCVFLAACFSLLREEAYQTGKQEGILQERNEQEKRMRISGDENSFLIPSDN